ncbi:hypothetical protein CP533_2936 [Ophiocordyceps camponoti-saundersi (nom. inval.)]|nr:hypothetical protein CP533_2936 [Ophiocordyceps camponoti-saundersi (nom. inval.)]
MYHTYGVLTPDTLPAYDAFAVDHMPVSQKRRPAQSMRVKKPSSANNSPRSSGRRRTFIVDGRQRQMMDYLAIPYVASQQQQYLHHQQQQRHQQQHHHHHQSNQHFDPPKQTFRPMSWHPSSYMQPAQPQRTGGYPFPIGLHTTTDSYDMSSSAGQPDFSPMMAASYSNDTSPCSTFSPLPLFPDCSRADAWDFSQRATPLYTPTSSNGQSVSEPMAAAVTQQQRPLAAADWDAYVMQGYDATSPPTPENPPAMQSQEPVPYQTQAEEEGEILVGMGLYDGPEKLQEDPQLNNYRSTVSCLLGSSLRPLEPRGKGLKLEETWEPPRSEDDDDEDPPSDEESV